jgi:predicted phage tail component-like protein
VKTESIPYIPPKRQITKEVQGRDGGYTFEDCYGDIQIPLKCKITGETLLDRRKTAREIAAWLTNKGTLIFDYEPDVEYTVVKITNDIKGMFVGYHLPVDEFTIIFECKPFQKQTYYNDNITWDDITSAWKYFNIPWNGEGCDRAFLTVEHGDTLQLANFGTYKARPIITLTGVAATVTIGPFTYTGLNGTIYVDCEDRVVYSESGGVKTNKLPYFTGTFVELVPGVTDLAVSGTITNLDVTFDYKNTYL